MTLIVSMNLGQMFKVFQLDNLTLIATAILAVIENYSLNMQSIAERLKNKMSTFVNVKSVCGKVSAPVDIFDLDLNPDGVICCNECNSILICRESWYQKFNYKK